jgi:cyclase
VIGDQLPTSSHFRLQQLADGVYSAIHRRGGAAISNAGIVDLGDRTLIYDALFTPQAAEDLRDSAEVLTGRPVDMVINSHYHNDHIWGNQVFNPATDILSTVVTSDLIATRGYSELDSFRQHAETNLRSIQAQFDPAGDERTRDEQAFWLDYYQGFWEARPAVEIRLPNLTFTERMILYGPDHVVELIPHCGGHTESDTILHLPMDGIVFVSDLLFVGCHPYLGGGDPDRLLSCLDEIERLEARTIVPGHGPVGTPDDLALMRRYVKTLDGLAQSLIEDGAPEEEVDRVPVPAPFQEWLPDQFFRVNLRFLYGHRSQGQAGRGPVAGP